MLQSKTKQFCLSKPAAAVSVCVILAIASVLLGNTSSIRISPYLRIGLGGLPNRAMDFLFGPIAGATFGAVMNGIKYMLRPDGPFYPVFTLSAATASVIYGMFLYKKPVRIRSVVLSCILVKLLVNCGMNTLWLSMLYGQPFFILLPVRALKNLAELPVDCLILYSMLKALAAVRNRGSVRT